MYIKTPYKLQGGLKNQKACLCMKNKATHLFKTATSQHSQCQKRRAGDTQIQAFA